MTPPSWSDVAADFATARGQAARAAARAADLPALAGEAREDAEMAAAKRVADAVSALERAIERLVELLDGELPGGRSRHPDLLERAARPMPGLRPAIIGAESRAALGRLMAFRQAFHHAYGTFDYALAAPNVALASEALPRAAAEVEAFCAALTGPPPSGGATPG